jgi:hypothetical protein
MEVVRHEAVRKTSDWDALLGLSKHVEESSVVPGAIEELKSADTPIQDVEHNPGRADSSAIWHGVTCNQDACQR